MCTFWYILMQIIFEVFPISSSGHVQLLERLGHFATAPECIFYMMHIPMLAILAIAGWQKIQQKNSSYTEWAWYGFAMIWYGFCALCGTLSVYVLFHHGIDRLQLPLVFGFIITACILLSLRFIPKDTDAPFTWWRALSIGLLQSLAFLPGVSRLATTYAAARLCKLSPVKSFWFSWWISIPIMLFGIAKGFFDVFTDVCAKDVVIQFFMQPCIWVGIIICTAIAYVGFVCIEYAAKKELLWYCSLYMMIPIICTLFIGVVK